MQSRNVLASLFLVLLTILIVFKQRNRQPTQEQVSALNKLIDVTKINFDETSHDHITLLELVQTKFKVENWTDIGFQRKNSPVTDFRSFGLLSLHCLLRTEAHLKMQKFKSKDADCLPFALSYLNIGHQYIETMKKNPKFLAQHTFSENVIDDFVKYVDTTLVDFERFWLSQRPENIMAYNQLWSKYEKKHFK
ncbi:ELMO/CED-12_domain-containing protein [Hexamita inflata]|uniref:ELMO/CED-12_domain-containing protein n=1 Tax=Hexamita inflata TaxID=28002 RepID=A0ABP1HT04_9EUKA